MNRRPSYSSALAPAALRAFLLLLIGGLVYATVAAAQTTGEVGGGPAFNNPRAVAADRLGDLIIADFGSGAIFRVDGGTGDRSLLSDNADPAQGPALSQPAGLVALEDGRIFVSDLGLSAVVEIDPVDGTRTPLTPIAGEDRPLIAPFGLAAGRIKGKLQLVVADTGSRADGEVVGPVLIDPDSGEVRQVRQMPNNTVSFNDPRAIAVVPGTADLRGRRGVFPIGTILVANFGGSEVIAVNPASGRRSVVSRSASDSAPAIGTGVPLGSISDMAATPDGQRLTLVDLGNDAIVSVDLTSGDRTVLSSSGANMVGSGDDFRSPHGIEPVEAGLMITDFGVPGVIFVADDGMRSIFSASPVEGFIGIRAISRLADGDLVAADFGGNRIFSVDPVSGVRSLVSGERDDGTLLGDGMRFNGPVAAVELDADTLAVAQFQDPPGILLVDKVTGDRSPLAGFGVGSGPTVAARGFILDPNDPNRLLATSFNEDAVIAVDVVSGDRSFVSKSGVVGAGPALNNPLGIGVDPADSTLFVSDLGAGAVFAITPDGNRSVVSSNDGIGAGPSFESPFGISVIDGEIFVADNAGLFRVDRVSGDRTLLSPGGVLFSVRRRDEGSLFVSNFGAVQGIEIVDKATGEREILSNADVP